MNVLYKDLLNDGFTEVEANEILEYVVCGCSLDNAIQRVMER